MIIAIEGADACGKATQSKLLAERLKGTVISAPNYETDTGRAILGHLKRFWATRPALDMNTIWTLENAYIDTLVFQSLMIMNRYEMVLGIEAALTHGPVIFDRWSSSSIVYGACRGLDPEWCKLVQTALPVPDVNILIDVPIEEGFKRRPERRDRHETDRPFLEKVRLEYLKLWGWDAGPTLDAVMASVWDSMKADHKDWLVVNGLGTVEEVHERIWEVLKRRGPEGWGR